MMKIIKPFHSKYNHQINILRNFDNSFQNTLKDSFNQLVNYLQFNYRKTELYLKNYYFWNLLLVELPKYFLAFTQVIFIVFALLSIININYNIRIYRGQGIDLSKSFVCSSFEKITLYPGFLYIGIYFIMLFIILSFWAIFSHEVNNKISSVHNIYMPKLKANFFKFIISYILTVINIILAVVSTLLSLEEYIYNNLFVAYIIIFIIPIVSGIKFFQLWYLFNLPKNDYQNYSDKEVYQMLSDFKDYYNF